MLWDLIERGGVMMWPLLGLSVIAVAMVIERGLFWLSLNAPGQAKRVERYCQLLRRGDTTAARTLAQDDRSVYGRAVQALLDEPIRTTDQADAVLSVVVEAQRPRIERFMATLSTIITAAPMLGILGTVIGIISSFNVLSERTAGADPRAVSGGIAEALLSTAAGLTVAVVVLFPYNAFRVQIDRTLGRIEMLVAAAAASVGEGQTSEQSNANAVATDGPTSSAAGS